MELMSHSFKLKYFIKTQYIPETEIGTDTETGILKTYYESKKLCKLL